MAMKVITHAHINGCGDKYRNEYARILARTAKELKYTHVVVGCHGTYIASSKTMDEVRKIGIKPIRFAELNLKVDNNSHDHSHVAIINIPEQQIPGYKHKGNNTNIKDILPYLKSIRCKIVLCHPRDAAEISAWAPYIDGYEIANGLDWKRKFKDRDLSKQYPHLRQFTGADYHVWEGAGNPHFFTQLPDGYFGELYK